LSRIKGQGEEEARLGMATLMWISHSERPLKVDELCQALGVEIGSLDLDVDDVPSIGTLPARCQGLVTVDKVASTVRLIHFTLQEYLRAHPELFGRAHSTMAETCLSYLNSHKVMALRAHPEPFGRAHSSVEETCLSYLNSYKAMALAASISLDLRDTPFLEYSSLYWGVHAKRSLSDCAKLLALKLFDNYGNHISLKIILKGGMPLYSGFNFNKNSLFNGLHCASFFGIVDIVAGLVGVEGCDIN